MSLALILRLAPWALIVLVGIWGAWERDGWQRAERRIVEQQVKILTDANDTYRKVGEIAEAMDAQIAAGLAKFNESQRKIQALNDDYAKAVRSDANSKVALTPAERAALRMLSQGAVRDKAGGGAVQPADAPAPVR